MNNNDCVVGSSGTGKTTSYVYGNLAKMYGSYIIADTKGNLATKFSPLLKAHGYDVKILDFVNIEKSVGYNPMDSIELAMFSFLTQNVYQNERMTVLS